MLAAAIRVVARTAALQIEEVAATHATLRSANASSYANAKGKGKERQVENGRIGPESSGSRVVASHSDTATQSLLEQEQEEKSAELKEAEEKIQRLLRRVKHSPAGHAERPQVEALPEETLVPKTVLGSTPDHARPAVSSAHAHVELPTASSDPTSSPIGNDGAPSREGDRLPDQTRVPRTIMFSGITSSSLQLPSASHTSSITSSSTPGAGDSSVQSLSGRPSSPETILDTPPASLTDALPTEAAASEPISELVKEEDEEVCNHSCRKHAG
jgi:hypothetical protein